MKVYLCTKCDWEGENPPVDNGNSCEDFYSVCCPECGADEQYLEEILICDECGEQIDTDIDGDDLCDDCYNDREDERERQASTQAVHPVFEPMLKYLKGE